MNLRRMLSKSECGLRANKSAYFPRGFEFAQLGCLLHRKLEFDTFLTAQDGHGHLVPRASLLN